MPAPTFDKNADLRRRDPVPEDVRTPARDEAAAYIEDMWPAHLQDIAAEAGYSREHIRNTLDAYFILEGDDTNGTGARTDSETLTVEIPIPEGVEKTSFARGYLAGRLDEREG